MFSKTGYKFSIIFQFFLSHGTILKCKMQIVGKKMTVLVLGYLNIRKYHVHIMKKEVNIKLGIPFLPCAQGLAYGSTIPTQVSAGMESGRGFPRAAIKTLIRRTILRRYVLEILIIRENTDHVRAYAPSF